MTNGMRLWNSILLISRICYAAPTDAPNGGGVQTIQLATPLNASLSFPIPNSSYLSDQENIPINATFQDPPSITCDGKIYGFNPDISDCMTAIQYILPGRAQIAFARRHTPARTGNVFSLPLRLMGDEALCYFQPVISTAAQIGHVSLDEMREAAVTLLRQCGAAKSEGGLAINIGGDGNMALTMGVYNPQVLCRGLFPKDASCKDIIRGMPASRDTQIFGPQSDPSASVIVPYTLGGSDDSKCIGQLFSTSRYSDTESWFRVWEAATAIFSMCLRHGRAGVARGLGDNGELFLTLSSPKLLLANISGTGVL